mgnify:CR=1 FL=1
MKKKNLKQIKPVPVLLVIPCEPPPIKHLTVEEAKRIIDQLDSFSASKRIN